MFQRFEGPEESKKSKPSAAKDKRRVEAECESVAKQDRQGLNEGGEGVWGLNPQPEPVLTLEPYPILPKPQAQIQSRKE